MPAQRGADLVVGLAGTAQQAGPGDHAVLLGNHRTTVRGDADEIARQSTSQRMPLSTVSVTVATPPAGIVTCALAVEPMPPTARAVIV